MIMSGIRLRKFSRKTARIQASAKTETSLSPAVLHPPRPTRCFGCVTRERLSRLTVLPCRLSLSTLTFGARSGIALCKRPARWWAAAHCEEGVDRTWKP